jgi:hypothetical protein
MDNGVIEKVCTQVYKKFPGLKGTRPKTSSYSADSWLMIFEMPGKTGDGKVIHQTVRVVADKNGTIKKMTTSR